MTQAENKINVTIDGRQLTGQSGATILEVARENGIHIPTLCYLEGLTLFGGCRVCVVEVEGSRTLVGSCHTPITPGMVIHTSSPKVLQARKTILELLLSSHSGNCFMCDKANICELRELAASHDIGLPAFKSKKRYYPKEDGNTYVVRDLTKCVLCRRCVRACAETKKANLFGVAYRGFDSKVVFKCDHELNDEACRDCYACVLACPTGALMRRDVSQQRARTAPRVIGSATSK